MVSTGETGSVVSPAVPRGVRECFRWDMRGERLSLRQAVSRWLFAPGFRAVVTFRLTQWLCRRGWHLLAACLARSAYRFTGAEIHPSARIGPGLRLAHSNGVVIGAGVVIDENVVIYQQVSLGGRKEGGAGTEDRYPHIGAGCVLYAGAKVIGPVHVGAGAQVGANAVVLADVPAGAVAVGVPARVPVGGKRA